MTIIPDSEGKEGKRLDFVSGHGCSRELKCGRPRFLVLSIVLPVRLSPRYRKKCCVYMSVAQNKIHRA